MLDNQFNFSHVLARISFEDVDGNIKTLQGYVMIETSTLSYSPGALVKDDFQMQGNGRMDMFDGLIPCDTLVTDIIVTGQTASDGIIHISYTFTGPVYKVKYRIDDSGAYVYAVAGVTIDVPGLANANHTVEVIPVCQNGYEGVGRSERFQVTHAETCGSSITDITVNGTSFAITNTHSGAATQMKYRIDGGTWINALIDTIVSIAMIDPGSHTVEEIPICSNGVEGTGFTRIFNIAVQPALSKINWSFTPIGNYDSLSIFVNGTLVNTQILAGSGFFMAAVGASIRADVYTPARSPNRTNRLQVVDTTTSTTLFNHLSFAGAFLSANERYTFTANGDEFQITGTITAI